MAAQVSPFSARNLPRSSEGGAGQIVRGEDGTMRVLDAQSRPVSARPRRPGGFIVPQTARDFSSSEVVTREFMAADRIINTIMSSCSDAREIVIATCEGDGRGGELGDDPQLCRYFYIRYNSAEHEVQRDTNFIRYGTDAPGALEYPCSDRPICILYDWRQYTQDMTEPFFADLCRVARARNFRYLYIRPTDEAYQARGEAIPRWLPAPSGGQSDSGQERSGGGSREEEDSEPSRSRRRTGYEEETPGETSEGVQECGGGKEIAVDYRSADPVSSFRAYKGEYRLVRVRENKAMVTGHVVRPPYTPRHVPTDNSSRLAPAFHFCLKPSVAIPKFDPLKMGKIKELVSKTRENLLPCDTGEEDTLTPTGRKRPRKKRSNKDCTNTESIARSISMDLRKESRNMKKHGVMLEDPDIKASTIVLRGNLPAWTPLFTYTLEIDRDTYEVLRIADVNAPTTHRMSHVRTMFKFYAGISADTVKNMMRDNGKGHAIFLTYEYLDTYAEVFERKGYEQSMWVFDGVHLNRQAIMLSNLFGPFFIYTLLGMNKSDVEETCKHVINQIDQGGCARFALLPSQDDTTRMLRMTPHRLLREEKAGFRPKGPNLKDVSKQAVLLSKCETRVSYSGRTMFVADRPEDICLLADNGTVVVVNRTEEHVYYMLSPTYQNTIHVAKAIARCKKVVLFIEYTPIRCIKRIANWMLSAESCHQLCESSDKNDTVVFVATTRAKKAMLSRVTITTYAFESPSDMDRVRSRGTTRKNIVFVGCENIGLCEIKSALQTSFKPSVTENIVFMGNPYVISKNSSYGDIMQDVQGTQVELAQVDPSTESIPGMLGLHAKCATRTIRKSDIKPFEQGEGISIIAARWDHALKKILPEKDNWRIPDNTILLAGSTPEKITIMENLDHLRGHSTDHSQPFEKRATYPNQRYRFMPGDNYATVDAVYRYNPVTNTREEVSSVGHREPGAEIQVQGKYLSFYPAQREDVSNVYTIPSNITSDVVVLFLSRPKSGARWWNGKECIDTIGFRAICTASRMARKHLVVVAPESADFARRLVTKDHSPMTYLRTVLQRAAKETTSFANERRMVKDLTRKIALFASKVPPQQVAEPGEEDEGETREVRQDEPPNRGGTGRPATARPREGEDESVDLTLESDNERHADSDEQEALHEIEDQERSIQQRVAAGREALGEFADMFDDEAIASSEFQEALRNTDQDSPDEAREVTRHEEGGHYSDFDPDEEDGEENDEEQDILSELIPEQEAIADAQAGNEEEHETDV